MIAQSLPEYQEISKSVRSVNETVSRLFLATIATSVSSFAAVVFFIARSGDAVTLAIILFLVATLTLLMLILINYKCASHNRFAAYLNLISAEKFSHEPGPNAPYAVSFGYCMERLNRVLAEKTMDFSTVKGEFFRRQGVFKGLNGSAIDRVVARSYSRNINVIGIEPIDLKDGDANNEARWKEELCYAKSDRSDGFLESRWYQIPRTIGAANLLLWGSWPKREWMKKASWRLPTYINRIVIMLSLAQATTAMVIFSIEKSWCNSGVCKKHFHQLEWLCFPFFDVSCFISFLIGLLLILVYFRLFAKCVEDWMQLTFGARRIHELFLQLLPFRMIYLRDLYDTDYYQCKPYYAGLPLVDPQRSN